MTASNPFPEVEDLVPHRGPARMIQRVLEITDGELRVAGRIPVQTSFRLGGEGAPCYVGVDFLAQAAAALEALRPGTSHPPRSVGIGYLVGIREARFQVRRLPLDREFTVQVRLRARAGLLSEYEASLAEGDETRLGATLSIFRFAPGTR